MAASPHKKGFSIKFDLSIGGLLGVGVVCFCVFLWMFLLGVWAGQTGLISGVSFPSQAVTPEPGKGEATRRKAPPAPVLTPPVESPPAPLAAPEVAAAPEAAVLAVEPQAAPEQALAPSQPRAKVSEAPFYAIQVGAFRDRKNVEDELRLWRARGYEAFSRPPGENERLTKVYVGHYPDAATARKKEAALAKKRKISPLIVMIRPE